MTSSYDNVRTAKVFSSYVRHILATTYHAPFCPISSALYVGLDLVLNRDQGMLAKSKETGRAGVRDTGEHACEVEGMRGDVSKLRQAVRLSFLAAECRGAG